MKLLFNIITISCLVASCSNAIKNETKQTANEDSTLTQANNIQLQEPVLITNNVTILNTEDLYGYWVGDFEPDFKLLGEAYESQMTGDETNKINISIDSFSGDEVFGHSVVAGLRRPFKGTKEERDYLYRFTVKEPGDDKYDGEFSFTIEKGDSILKGTWKAYDTVKTQYRVYSLKKKIFKYNPEQKLEYTYSDWSKTKDIKVNYEEEEEWIEEGVLSSTEKIFEYNPSIKVLNDKELRELTKGDIIVLRNSIYAKHGYSFKKRALRDYFDGLDWYMPVFVDIKPFLTEIEKINIANMLKYEKHAESYYDVFGR